MHWSGHLRIEMVHGDGEGFAQLFSLAQYIGIEERSAHNPEGQTHHLTGNVDNLTISPLFLYRLAIVDHDIGIGGNVAISWSTIDRKSTRLNSSHLVISYAVFC